jgi:hypothetical protein
VARLLEPDPERFLALCLACGFGGVSWCMCESGAVVYTLGMLPGAALNRMATWPNPA